MYRVIEKEMPIAITLVDMKRETGRDVVRKGVKEDIGKWPLRNHSKVRVFRELTNWEGQILRERASGVAETEWNDSLGRNDT